MAETPLAIIRLSLMFCTTTTGSLGTLFLAAALSGLVGTGCVTERPMMTWADAPKSPSTIPSGSLRSSTKTPSRAQASRAQPSTAARRAMQVDEQEPEDAFGGGEDQASSIRTPAGLQIDRALTQFTAARVADRRISRRSHKHAIRWLRVLAEIDDACTLQPMADDLGAFVRARVTLEVEAQSDEAKKRALPPDLAKRIDDTLGGVDARVAELRLVAPPGSMGPSRSLTGKELVLRSPVSPMIITSPFGLRTDPIHGGQRFHAGTDFGAPKGTMVYAATNGVVIYANWQGGYGRHVVIDHGEGIRTHYSHLDELYIKAGEIVDAGDTIGSVGETGRATGPHLHFAVTNHEGQFLDPAGLIDRVVARDQIADLRGVRKPRLRRIARRR